MNKTNTTIRNIFSFLMAPSTIGNSEKYFWSNFSHEDVVQRAIVNFQGTVHNPRVNRHFTGHTLSGGGRQKVVDGLLNDPVLGKMYQLTRDILMSDTCEITP
jgi:hypothetical protein